MGVPKARLAVRGEPMLAYLLDRWRWPGPTVLVTAPGLERPPGAEAFAREVSDPVADEGPLRGVLTALEHAETPTLLVVTCDMPCVTGAQLRWLLDALRARPGVKGAMCRHASDAGTQVEPFPCALSRDALPRVRDEYLRGGRSPMALSRLEGFVTPDAPTDWPAATWTNLNRPTDLARFLADLSHAP